MSHVTTLLAILLLGFITFLYRYSFVSRPGKKLAEKIPESFLHLLAPAAFSAIMINNILSQNSGGEDLKQKSLVAAVSLIVAYFSRSMLATVLFGLGLLYVLQNYRLF